MPDNARTRIGWLGPSLPSSAHIKKFLNLVPANVDVLYERLILHDGVLNDVQGKLDLIVSRAAQFADKEKLDGLIFPGAPREVLNPGLFEGFSKALKIPVATALRSSATALKTVAAKRVLLLTPFDAGLNQRIRDFLNRFAIDAVSPAEMLQHYTDALKMTPDDVIAYARRAVAEQSYVDAIYFQGAVLDPMDCLEQMERELHVPVVASNLAMNWYMLSKLGLRHPMKGFGKLMANWPPLPSD
jgi:maleate cis-trans isomerase